MSATVVTTSTELYYEYWAARGQRSLTKMNDAGKKYHGLNNGFNLELNCRVRLVYALCRKYLCFGGTEVL
jgi:hypothetical protein